MPWWSSFWSFSVGAFLSPLASRWGGGGEGGREDGEVGREEGRMGRCEGRMRRWGGGKRGWS